MILSLAGYMGSGKSHISKLLSKKTGFPLIDLDKEIVRYSNATIPEIFQQKGEIFFRKEERRILQELLNSGDKMILSLGGGTPAYYDNIELINKSSTSIYLRANIGTLVDRLSRQKAKRPLIANLSDEELPEFIAKHLFERNPYYSQCQFTVDTDGKAPEDIVNEIILLVGL